MRKTITRLIALCSAAASIALAGCGSSGSSTATSTATLSGVAATGAPIVGTAYIKDSSTPARELSAPTGSDGSYSFNVEGMTPPFIVKVNWGTQSLMSFATTHGTANVTPLTHIIVANAAGVTDPASLYTGFTAATQQQMAASIAGATTALQTRLKPLFDLYGVTTNPLTGTFVANHTGLDAMLDAVSVTISSGNMVVTNKTTNATIFTAPIQNMTAGTFTMGNMPTIGQVPPAATLDGAALYGSKCASCHGVLASSNKKGATAARIQTAITNNV
ncbi:MAG TPA: cytochrome c, partial [Geomobilimonas sp.]|nr:cytochrome c [Geomobilimonas sp.]